MQIGPVGNAVTTSTQIQPGAAASVLASSVSTEVIAAELARVNVLAVLPDGRVHVQIDGQDELATTTEQLAAGGQYVLQVERTSAGTTLSSAPDSPDLPATLSAAILRTALPPDLAAALKPLLAELANFQQTPTGSSLDTPAIRQAAAGIDSIVRSFIPADGSPLNATQLQNLVENGGLHFEAKLARLVSDGGENPSTNGDASNTATSRTGSASPDLKEALLRLLQAAQEFGSSVQFPAARSTLDGIETQQAANVFAQTQGTPYILQIPFPDGGEWRTLHLAIESDSNRQQSSGSSGGFRILMHVPLTELGETWIDAGLSGNSLRAVIYLSQPNMREQIRAELPALRSELLTESFGEVLLDVRPASELPAAQRKQAEAMQIGRPGSGSILDVRA
jgi:uncharacterized protein (DUF736 family)